MAQFPAPDRNDQLRATDLFPELSDDMDRRISHSESRIKFWVVAGVMLNLLAITIPGISAVFYLGTLAQDVVQLERTQVAVLTRLESVDNRVQENSLWRARMEGERARGER